MERVAGIEPTLLIWKTRALPICHTRVAESIGIEPILHYGGHCLANKLITDLTTFHYESRPARTRTRNFALEEQHDIPFHHGSILTRAKVLVERFELSSQGLRGPCSSVKLHQHAVPTGLEPMLTG